MPRFLLVLVASLGLGGCGFAGGAPEQELDTVITGVNYVGVSLPDGEASAQFYQSAFETTQLGEGELDLAALPKRLAPTGVESAQSRLVRSANAQLRVMSFAGEPPADWSAVTVTGPGIAHVCFQAVDDTNAYAKALAAGATPIGAEELVELSSRNPVKYGYITDPNGIITEVEEVDVSRLDLPEPPKNRYRMRHVAIATPDVEALAEFYSALLGGQEARRLGDWFGLSGENFDKVAGLENVEIEMAWFQLRNLELEIAQIYSHPTERNATPRPLHAPGYNMIMFDVSDLEAAKQRLLDAGGTLVGESEAFDGVRTIFGRDPDGNLLGLQMLPGSSIYSAQNFADNGI